MALVRKKVSTVKWPVSVKVPADGGKWHKATFTGIFKLCTLTEYGEYANQGDPELIKAVLEDWEGIEEEDGTEVPFNSKNLDSFLDDPHWIRGTTLAVLELLNEGAAKN